MEGWPEKVRENFRMEALSWEEVFFSVDRCVDTAGVHDVAEHDFAGLEVGLAEADFEELKDADLHELSQWPF